jgi:hypothetical protein
MCKARCTEGWQTRTELGGADANHADDGAIDGGDHPALPKVLAEEDGAQDGQNTGKIVESNQIKCVEPVGLMSRYRSRFQKSTGALGFSVLLFARINPGSS